MNIEKVAYTREDVLRRCADMRALYGARRAVLCEGPAAGLRVIEVKTAGRLRCLLAEDRCLDIVELDYAGINIGFLSKNGLNAHGGGHVSAGAVDHGAYWIGGMLSTCGLRNAGPVSQHAGESHPAHGMIGLAAASQVGIEVSEEAIVITGVMREAHMFGHAMEMRRRIVIPSDGARIDIRDEVRNLTPEAEPLLLLYHFNFGFPFLDEGLELHFSEGTVEGRTPWATERIADHRVITPPIDGEPEQVFFHRAAEKEARARLISRKLGMKADILYNTEQLPILSQWKSMRSGDYALGIEPGTSLLRGRGEELKNGYDVAAPGYGTRVFEVSLALSEALT